MKRLIAVVTQQQLLLLAFLTTDLTFLQHDQRSSQSFVNLLTTNFTPAYCFTVSLHYLHLVSQTGIVQENILLRRSNAEHTAFSADFSHLTQHSRMPTSTLRRDNVEHWETASSHSLMPSSAFFFRSLSSSTIINNYQLSIPSRHVTIYD